MVCLSRVVLSITFERFIPNGGFDGRQVWFYGVSGYVCGMPGCVPFFCLFAGLDRMEDAEEDLVFLDEDEDVGGSLPSGPAWNLLIVDDDPGIHSITRVVLGDFEYDNCPVNLISAYTAREAWEILQTQNDIALVLLDVVMESDSAGLDLVHRIRRELGNHHLRIILRTGQPGLAPERKVIIDYDINDYRAKSELTADNLFSTIIAAIRGYKDLTTISHLYDKLKTSYEATVVVLADVAEFKDTDTGDHVLRVKRFSEDLARHLSLEGPYQHLVSDDMISRIGLASVLHDVGKVGIPDRILQKPGKLDAEEWDVMKTHAELGAQMLSKAGAMVGEESYLSVGAIIAGNHHEKFDGSGYPKGISAQEIPIEARIVAVADVFDALTSKRPYKEPWPIEKAVALLRENSGGHFDPTVVEAFVAVLKKRGMHSDSDSQPG